MHYKKFFSAAALVTLLSLSNSAFSSDPIGPISDEETSYYVRLQYNGEILPFYTKVDGITNATGKEKDSPLTRSFIAGGGAFGYKMDDIRVDVEGLYSKLAKDTDVVNTSETNVADSLTAFSGLVNVYYDIAIEDMPITPYVGVGIGAAYISNPSKADVVKDQKGFGFAYQAKAGVSYDVTPEIKLFAGARYFGSYGASFDKAAKDDTGIKNVVYSTVGAEAGVAFNF
ncbi:P44/Msp2 family outer membrane protein [Wolbachia endosymbiont of Diaphorina citri]|jgi:Opacity protein and related surface antigens|nr:P44/Msp2 family outer membrane protein [Wolbachia endosymbiont of Diaphorina citri]QJT94435.1 P44/Msp2 family outer membrane protein [Wolbachia endosymbiont of Diaphorina citri]QJT95676.1 P44/Msp2 family outer membrane protein [Wolbachia endosymbiont of Diaphorina citri]QJT97038.1 P44/Msp2 family outer membrane protein [Wolbachia endosymbiont of Diaphorina citri]QLK11333.1 P44/Msp2 family outer membrane protein [Wolbachia endosymbiont of Diaphorina citri]QXY87137.1 P44/Msp2 family outer mem